MDFQPLNPVLHSLLVRRYGEDAIEVVSAGRAMDWFTYTDSLTGDRKRKVEHSGEEYRMRCPRCHDHRPRLYINHRWGVYDADTDSYNLWLAQCFNEHCFHEYVEQKEFYDHVFSLLPPKDRRGRITIRQGTKVEATILGEMPPPGPMWRLDVLAKKHPHHDAIEYLESRRFDPVKLGKLWDISYCPESRYWLANNRIIIPVYALLEGKKTMVGWQARYIGDDVRGMPFNVAGVPKYWTSPGFKRSLTAYNFDKAILHPTVVIVEGPADVWSMGPNSLGLIGKTMSMHIVKRFVSAMKKHDNPVVVVMLDPLQDQRDKARGKPHQIERLRLDLIKFLPGRVLPIYLPKELDPGSAERSWLRNLIREKAAKKGLQVSFCKPKANHG